MCVCGASGRHKGRSSRKLMTALGMVVVWRTYFSCGACGLGGYFADCWLGVQGYLTRGAIRLICLLGGQGFRRIVLHHNIDFLLRVHHDVAAEEAEEQQQQN